MKRTLLTMFAALALVALPGYAAAQTAEADTDSMIRVLHLSPDAPAVDVFVNGSSDATAMALGFGESTAYLEVPAATYTFDVAAHGTSPDQAVLTIEDIALAPGTAYTAVAYNSLASIAPMALVDDHSPVQDGQIRVRAIHAASAVGQVDIWNIPAEGEPGMIYENVDFGVAGSYLELPAGAYTLGFDANDDATPDLVFSLPSLPAGTVANVFAVSSGSDVFLLAHLPDGNPARIDPVSAY